MTTSLRRGLPMLGGLAIALTACSSASTRLQAGYMQTTLTGDASLSTTAAGILASARADLEDGLGLGADYGSPFVRAELDLGPIRLTGSAFRYEDSGRGTLDASFGDISAGATVDSELKMGVLKAALTFDLLDLDVFRLSPGVGADIVSLDARATEVSTTLSESIEELLPIPMLFLQSEVQLGPASLLVDFGGIALDYDGFSGTAFDVEALLMVQPIDHLELFAGYRWISIDADGTTDDGDFTADLQLAGWFLGGGVRF